MEQIISRPNLPHPAVITDQTAVGAQVVGLFSQVIRSGWVKPVIITNGTGEMVESSVFGLVSVPKKDLVGSLQLVLQGRRLKIPSGLPHAELLLQELNSFRAKIILATTADMDWRERPHDDLVLAAAPAVWHAGRFPPYAPDSFSHGEPSDTQKVLDELFPGPGGWPW
ncbi:hypothetical protein [Zavarzinella formosa]|uniref:hypothetical protein n=1 Tax=Zavarzinella formosa TaxID=360055 RepID=UPI0002E3364F|nr:hypothetical protein [Zavarzinella formosa]